MSIIEYLTSNDGVNSFWAAIAAGVITQLIINLFQRNNNPAASVSWQTVEQKVIHIHNVNITRSSNPRQNGRRRKRINQDLFNFCIGSVLLGSVLYGQHQQMVLGYIFNITVFLFGIFATNITYALWKNFIHGKEWKAVLAFSFAFMLASLFLIHTALHPVYPLEMEQTSNWYGLLKLGYFVYQFLGAAILTGCLLLLIVTIFNYTLRIAFVTGGNENRFLAWVIGKTNLVTNPPALLITITIGYTIAYLFVSGFAFHWIKGTIQS